VTPPDLSSPAAAPSPLDSWFDAQER
jgi:hypothetical protein